jgi:very-short-patch-repair endonuclease
MNKSQYILRSLSKIRNKTWEHYVVNRIYHRLNDPQIEFVCQQAFRHKNLPKIYLADLFLPQLRLYLEIDEGHHASEDSQIKDAIRRLDIADATDCEEFRIAVRNNVSLEALDAEIEEFIQKVRERKAAATARNDFRPWDYEHRFEPSRHLDAGYIEVGPDTAFRTHRDALRCFGYQKGHLQKAVWSLPDVTVQALGEKGAWIVWFPKLYKYKDWSNTISEDGTEITEICMNDRLMYTAALEKRIVMAHAKDELNRTLYRFLGVFEVISGFQEGLEHRYRRIKTRIPTV